MSPPGSLRRTAILATGVCLLAALVAGIGLGALPPASDGSDAPRVVETEGTSNYLSPDAGDTVREDVNVQRVDPALAVAADADALAGRLERSVAQRSLYDVSPNSRPDVARAQVENLSALTARLRTAQRDARAAYRDGRLSAGEYFRRIARLDVGVAHASALRSQLERRVRELGADAQEARVSLRNLAGDIETLDGPVTDRVRARYEGNASAGETLVRVTGNDGVVHVTTDGGTLYREAQEVPDWNRDGPNRFVDGSGSGGEVEALERARDLYPWAYSNAFGSPTPGGRFGDSNLYKSVVVHQHGTLTVYLDAALEDAFREVQENQVGAAPTTWRRSTAANDTTLTVEGTHPTGWLVVNLTRAGSDAPIDGEIRIDDQLVGSTGDDGRLETVTPTGGFTLNATSGDDSVTLSVPADVA